ncbi:MAG: hypothetical protein QOI82_2142 [Actinomycetota bacterium]|jgi:hypothetical protein|nr:hypothetical protein [Actinomycetota bacterium]
MERARSDVPLYLAAVAALAITAGIIYAVVDASTVEATFDSNSPNATTGGPPASFEQP